MFTVYEYSRCSGEDIVLKIIQTHAHTLLIGNKTQRNTFIHYKSSFIPGNSFKQGNYLNQANYFKLLSDVKMHNKLMACEWSNYFVVSLF